MGGIFAPAPRLQTFERTQRAAPERASARCTPGGRAAPLAPTVASDVLRRLAGWLPDWLTHSLAHSLTG